MDDHPIRPDLDQRIVGALVAAWDSFFVFKVKAEIPGTPPGVALGMKPPQYLKPGDVVELGIEGLGEQRQTVLAST